MSSATKTLELLSYFTKALPEVGLSQLCRLTKRNKATTYRQLQTLEETGFIEQNPLTKKYRLGPSILQIAQMREATVPRKAGAELALSNLAKTTGETTHVAVLSGTKLYPLASCDTPTHSIRAIIDVQTFPLHATASGLCTLGFGPSDLFDFAITEMTEFTRNTVKTAEELTRAIHAVQNTGFAKSNGSFEDEIDSLSAPLFDHTGLFAGTVSVASVATRLTPELETCIRQNLIIASREITRNWGGAIPTHIEALWANSVEQPQELEAAS